MRKQVGVNRTVTYVTEIMDPTSRDITCGISARGVIT